MVSTSKGMRMLKMWHEFNSLADDANIYKLVGPVLLKQDTTEAKSTVDGRLEYIGGEMYGRDYCDDPLPGTDLFRSKRIEDSIKEITEKSERKKMEVSLVSLLEC